jgi:hypothetical protein
MYENKTARDFLTVKGKVKVSLCLTKHHAMKAYWRSRGIAPRILDLSAKMEVSGHLHAPAALSPGKEPVVPIGKEAGWAVEPFWTRW